MGLRARRRVGAEVFVFEPVAVALEREDLGVVDEAVLHRYRLPEGALVVCLGAVRPKKSFQSRRVITPSPSTSSAWRVITPPPSTSSAFNHSSKVGKSPQSL